MEMKFGIHGPSCHFRIFPDAWTHVSFAELFFLLLTHAITPAEEAWKLVETTSLLTPPQLAALIRFFHKRLSGRQLGFESVCARVRFALQLTLQQMQS